MRAVRSSWRALVERTNPQRRADRLTGRPSGGAVLEPGTSAHHVMSKYGTTKSDDGPPAEPCVRYVKRGDGHCKQCGVHWNQHHRKTHRA